MFKGLGFTGLVFKGLGFTGLVFKGFGFRVHVLATRTPLPEVCRCTCSHQQATRRDRDQSDGLGFRLRSSDVKGAVAQG